MITTWLYVISGLIVSIGLFSLFPTHKNDRAVQVRRLYGFEDTQKQAMELGIRLTVKHYLILVTISVSSGVLAAWMTKNILLAGVAVGVGFMVPKMILSSIRYKRRKELLMNLPSNLRVLASKFRDNKSLRMSLQMSLPVMDGVSKPHFQNLYDALRLNVPQTTALNQMKKNIGFSKFDDLCEKITMGQHDGYHARVVEGIRKTIDDIDFDIQHLQRLDIDNRKKRFIVYLIFGICWAFPFLFGYMESEIAAEFGMVTTLHSPIGKILIASMCLNTFIGFFKRDKFLRLNLDDL
ncbi:uncharacterized membrane protein (DUF485 family) [Fontibacillus solani]|uniref:Uncharacterized membrane protein (DUF485 family) n=1 Tax=Fontibacillus solani TaxID=1572857 RepID=A0A7W3XSF6_9BACL|nr:hypothetical protein [Fontibacillus solani]MBA9086496.1 uncharacterized membrane protein (DUF485 family) [Fontibacillus solani]